MACISRRVAPDAAYSRLSGRIVVAVIAAACLLAATASAQVARGVARTPGITFQPPPQRPQVEEPVPHDRPVHTSRRDPQTVAPAVDGDLFRAGPKTYAPRYGRTSRFSRHPIVLAPYPYVFYGGSAGAQTATSYDLAAAGRGRAKTSGHASSHSNQRGRLRLQVDPPTAEVYIDAVYAGLVADFDMPGGRSVEAGLHHVEIRDAGLQVTSFEFRIAAGETTTYRHRPGTLDTAVPSAQSAATARTSAPRVIYVVPRCYAGDRPPAPSQLPPGCDAAALRVIHPLP